MYASSLALRPSRWRHLAYLCALALVCCAVALLPLQGLALWLGSFPMFVAFYWLLLCWQRPLRADLLMLAADGRLRWQHDRLPAGVLLSQSLICSWGIWLYWQDEQRRVRQLWLYQDNFSVADFRMLARHCQLMRWQAGAV